MDKDREGAPDDVADQNLRSANRWAYKYALLAMWVKANCTPDEVDEARSFVADGSRRGVS